MAHKTLSTQARLALTVAMASIGLAAAGCDRAAPGETDIAIPSEADLAGYGMAPAVDDLPGSDPAPIGVPADGQDYGWIEDAYYVNHAFDDSPPDYAYGYDDTEWWGWESDDGWYRIVEPLAGSDRYYYYRPGDDRPFYVMDDGWGYGFSNGALMAVYDRSGRSMPREFVRSRSDYAGRYLHRAREARAARQTAQRWQVAESRWERRQDRFVAEQARLERASQQQVPWRNYRRALERTAPPERLKLDREQVRRQAQRAERREARSNDRREDRQEARTDRREDRRDRREDRREDRRDEARTSAGPPPPVTVPARPDREDRAGPGKGRGKSEAAHERNAERKAGKAQEKAERKRARDEDKAERRSD